MPRRHARRSASRRRRSGTTAAAWGAWLRRGERLSVKRCATPSSRPARSRSLPSMSNRWRRWLPPGCRASANCFRPRRMPRRRMRPARGALSRRARKIRASLAKGRGRQAPRIGSRRSASARIAAQGESLRLADRRIHRRFPRRRRLSMARDRRPGIARSLRRSPRRAAEGRARSACRRRRWAPFPAGKGRGESRPNSRFWRQRSRSSGSSSTISPPSPANWPT